MAEAARERNRLRFLKRARGSRQAAVNDRARQRRRVEELSEGLGNMSDGGGGAYDDGGGVPGIAFRNLVNNSMEASEASVAGDGAAADEVVEEKERFEPQLSRNRELEIRRLGLPGCRAKCFGCVYIGETKSAAIPQADLRKLVDMARKSLGQTDLLVLCEAMAEFIETLDGPIILAGDFNTTVWSPNMRRVLEAGDLHDVRLGRGIMPTWPMHPTLPLMLPIDGCFITDHFTIQSLTLERDLRSDHLPIEVKLSL